MTRVFMALYPGYVNLFSAKAKSPRLFEFLESHDIEIEEYPWLGTIKSLPKGGPIIVRYSSMIPDDYDIEPRDLARACSELGHICFYDDSMLVDEGSYWKDTDVLLEEMGKWLKKNHYTKIWNRKRRPQILGCGVFKYKNLAKKKALDLQGL